MDWILYCVEKSMSVFCQSKKPQHKKAHTGGQNNQPNNVGTEAWFASLNDVRTKNTPSKK